MYKKQFCVALEIVSYCTLAIIFVLSFSYFGIDNWKAWLLVGLIAFVDIVNSIKIGITKTDKCEYNQDISNLDGTTVYILLGHEKDSNNGQVQDWQILKVCGNRRNAENARNQFMRCHSRCVYAIEEHRIC